MLKLRFSTLILLFVSLCIFTFGISRTTHAAVVNQTLTNRITNGLIGYWTFDAKDISNGVLRDVSGNGNNANLRSIASSTFYAVGKIGQGGNFDGVNDFATTTTDFLGTGPLTISFWTYTRSAGGSSNGSVISNSQTRVIMVSANRIGFGSDGSGNAVSASNSLPFNTWKFVTITRNSIGTANIYIDGVLSGSADQESGTPTAGMWTVIGNRPNGSNTTAWDGVIDDLRVYNRILSVAEIQALYNIGNTGARTNQTISDRNKSDLKAHWTFDGKDLVNGAVIDKSGNGKTANLKNVASTTFYTMGKIGSAFKFDGVDDYITVPNTSDYTEDFTAITVSAWVRNDMGELPDSFAYVAKGGFGEASTWTLYKTSGEAWAFTIKNATPATVTALSAGNLNEDMDWHHVVGTWDGSTVRIYVDGVDVSNPAQSQSGALRNTAMNISIGANSTGADEQAAASVDDVRIYNRALTANEIQQLFNQSKTKVNVSPTNSLASGLIGYWTFDGPDMIGGVTRDKSGQGNNGNLINIASSTFYKIGKIGQAGNFDGVNDYVHIKTISSGEALDLTGDNFTMSAWVKFPTNSNSKGIFMFGDAFAAHATGLQSTISSGLQKFTATLWRGTNGALSTLCNTTIPVNTWTHILQTWDGTNLRSYIDGTLCSTSANTSSDYNFNGASLSIGTQRTNNTTDVVGAAIDEARVYDRALTATEILELYNMGR